MKPFDYDEYFDNYNEFDSQVSEFKDSLKEGLKKQISDEITKLREENKSLKHLKDNYDLEIGKLKGEARKKERELEETIRNYGRQDLESLLKKYYNYANVWEVNYKYTKKEKCKHCNEERKMVLIDTIYNKRHKVRCGCDTTEITNYYVKQVKTRLYISKDDSYHKKGLRLEVMFLSDDYYNKWKVDIRENGEDLKISNDIYDKFDKNIHKKDSGLGSLFLSKEEAQKYADYLNEEIKKEVKQ